MSSGFKKQLLQSQAYSGTTKKGDVVVLPPDSEDVILVTKCSGKNSGVVKATLEHSPDENDANFSSVQSEKISHTAGGSGWGNLKYLDTTATGTGSDYKNKTVKANNLSGQSHDIFHDTMTKDDPWTISTWIKSNEQPSTLALNQFTKCLEVSDSTDTGAFLEIENTCGSGSSDFHDGNISTASTKSWTMSFWYKSPSNSVPNSTSVSRYMAYFGRSWGLYLGTDGKFYLDNLYISPEIVMPTGINLFDGNWHHVTFTWRHDSGGSTTASNYKTAANNATDPGSSLFIDGQPCTTTGWTAYHTLPPFIASDMGIAGYNPGVSSAIGSVPGRYAHLAIETGAQVAADASARYNTGVPTDLSSTVPIYLNFENDSNDSGTSSISSSTNLDEQGTGHNSSGTPDSDYPSVVHGSIFSIATLSDTTMKVQSYEDNYLPVLFSTGSSVNMPPVPNFENTKSVFIGGSEATSNNPVGSLQAYGTYWNGHADYTLGSDAWWTRTGYIDLDRDWSYSIWINRQDVSDNASGNMFLIFKNSDHVDMYRYDVYYDVYNERFEHAIRYRSGHDAQATRWFYPYAISNFSDDTYFNVICTNDADETVINGGSNYNYRPGTNFKIYVDGVELTLDSTNSQGTDSTDTTFAYSHTAKPTTPSNTSKNLIIGNDEDRHYSRHANYEITDVSIWSKTLSSSEVTSLYNGGTVKDISGESNLTAWWRFGDGNNGSGTADSVFNSDGLTFADTGALLDARIYDMSGNNRHLVPLSATSLSYGQEQRYIGFEYGNANHKNASGNVDSGFTNLTSSDSVYIAPSSIPAYDVFGNGMRMSFTKKLKPDATWDATGAQTSRFLLSFDGFEDTADYFLGYNTTFTRPLHPKTGVENASADLLDGEWHNIIVSYRGGAPGTAVNPHDYIAVCFDGKQMAASGVCSIDPSTHTTQAACEGAGGTWIGGCVEKTSTVTFVNDHFRYTDVSEDLRGTFFLSAGTPFTTAGANSKYAFQGGFDETSLHDDSWQLSSSPTTGWAVGPTGGGFNTMKPNTIYGIDNTRNGANDAGSPYDLKNPSSIGHPGPTGNSYLEPSASAVGGGLQAYYRWGDTPGDCSTSIHDVQSAIDNVTDRDLAVLYGSIAAGDATDENSAAWNTAVDTVAEGGIEVAAGTTEGTSGFALENVQITCADGLQFFRVNAPKLPNLRIKWTGAGTATSVEASIHYRRRKK